MGGGRSRRGGGRPAGRWELWEGRMPFWGYREERAAKVVRVREGAAVFSALPDHRVSGSGALAGAWGP